MFFIHSMFSLELIALVAGVALLIMIKNQDKIKSAWLSFVAWFVIILSALSLICSAYYTVDFWHSGGFRMHKAMMMKRGMVEKNENKEMNQEAGAYTNKDAPK